MFNIAEYLRNFTSFIRGGFQSLSPLIFVLFIIAFTAMVLLIILVILVTRKKAIKIPFYTPEKKDDHEKKLFYQLPPFGVWISDYLSRKEIIKVSNISLSFLRALEFLKKSLGAYGYKYQVPWYLVLGSEEAGKTSLFKRSEINLPLGEIDLGINNPDCQWWFLGNSVFLDIKGNIFIGKDEKPADEINWNSLLCLLARYRAIRPLNGIVLCIPASELYGAKKLSQGELIARANYISQKLNLAHHNLGLRLPVYIIVTKSDSIPGFHQFCAELPEKYRGNMLGWSSPFTLSTAYTSQWIQEAFQAIGENLNEIKLEMLSHGAKETTKDGVFLFPDELIKTKDSLEIYLNSIFNKGGYQENSLLRGFYFTGQYSPNDRLILSQEKQEGDSSQPNFSSKLIKKTQEIIFFGKDLLTKKIPHEPGIVTPLRKRLLRLNRSLTIAKITTAFFILISSYGLFNAYERFSQQRNHVVPVLHKMRALMSEMNAFNLKNNNNHNLTISKHTQELIQIMNHLEDARFFSIFIPSSWFSAIDSKLKKSLKVSYQHVVLKTIYIDLLLKARSLLHLTPSEKSRTLSLSNLLNPSKSTEFLLVKNFIDAFSTLEKNIYNFNNLQHSADPETLNTLIHYTFGTTLPQPFIDQFYKFRSILKDSPFPTINLNPYEPLARKTLNLLYQDFLNALSGTHNSHNLVKQLTAFVEKLSQRNVKLLPSLVELRKMSSELSLVLPEIGTEGKTWLDEKIFNPGKAFNEFFDKVDEIKLFGPEVTQFLVNQSAIAFHNLKIQMEPLNRLLANHFIASPLERGEIPKEQKEPLSKGLFTLEKSLRLLFSQPFMVLPSQQKFIENLPSGKIVYWDEQLVQAASNLVQLFEEFNNKNIRVFPAAIQENMKQFAKASLRDNIKDLLAKAQTFGDIPFNISEGLQAEEILKSKIGEIKTLYPRFLKLLDILNQESLGISFTELRSLLAKNSYWLLSQVSKIFHSLSPYNVQGNSNFDWWKGKSGASLSGYSVKDIQDLETYLDLQRKQIEKITLEYARPIVAFLTAPQMIEEPTGDQSLLNQWRRIVEQVELYTKKQAGNSLSSLELFILQEFNNYNLKNIFDLLKNDKMTVPSGDYFIEHIRQMKQGILARAEVLKRQEGIKNYKNLIVFFNENLRNQFPFVGANARLGENEASPEIIREFFRLYDAAGGSPKKILEQIYQLGPSVNPCLQFLEMMEQIKKFFKNYLDGQGDYDLPTFDFSIDFRANRDKEVGGDLIVEWKMKPDDDTVISKNDKKGRTGRWIYGSPVEFTFRWPEGDHIPAAPSVDEKQPNLTVEKTTAKFRYTSNWALLWLFKTHATPKGDYLFLKDPNPYMLKFTIPTDVYDKAIIYNIVTLFSPPPNPKAPGRILKVPDFPVFAPSLPDVVEQYSTIPVLTKSILKLGNTPQDASLDEDEYLEEEEEDSEKQIETTEEKEN